MATIPRVRIKAIELLAEGRSLSKQTLAGLAPCHERTAQRVLKALHEEPLSQVYIRSWDRAHQVPIPVYALPPRRPDVPPPSPLTSTEKARRRRKDPEVREQEAAAKRNKRDLTRAASRASVLRLSPLSYITQP